MCLPDNVEAPSLVNPGIRIIIKVTFELIESQEHHPYRRNYIDITPLLP